MAWGTLWELYGSTTLALNECGQLSVDLIKKITAQPSKKPMRTSSVYHSMHVIGGCLPSQSSASIDIDI